MVREYIAKGNLVNEFDDGGQTPLVCASTRMMVPEFMVSENPEFGFEIAKLLIENGADVNVCDKSGTTPLMATADALDTRLAKLLVERGAIINIKGPIGQTALHRAGRSNSSTMVNFLVEKGAEINITDNGGNTPLHLAMEQNQAASAIALVDNGADMSIKNAAGITALEVTKDEMLKKFLIHSAPKHKVDAAITPDDVMTKSKIGAGSNLTVTDANGNGIRLWLRGSTKNYVYIIPNKSVTIPINQGLIYIYARSEYVKFIYSAFGSCKVEDNYEYKWNFDSAKLRNKR
jgi:ankyrin repeat protein